MREELGGQKESGEDPEISIRRKPLHSGQWEFGGMELT